MGDKMIFTSKVFAEGFCEVYPSEVTVARTRSHVQR